MLNLQWPWMLLLLPLPLFALRLLKPLQIQLPALHSRVYTQLATSGEQYRASKGALLQKLLLAMLWLGLILASCRPQWIGDPIALPTSGRDLLLAVDISESMQIEDMARGNEMEPRLISVKRVVKDFVARRSGDKLGLILFGSQAYLQVPLTFDRKTVEVLLDEARIGFAGKATAIGDAIGIAIKRLESRPDTSRVLILLSDGADTASELPPRKAAELAARHGIRIYTVGIGAERIVRQSFFGARTINPSADLDEAMLTDIAKTTGGQYFRARNPEELGAIYQQLDQLEPVAQEQEVIRPTSPLFYWPLAVAFVTLIILVTLQGRRVSRG